MGILSSVIIGTGIKGLGVAAGAAGSVISAAGGLAKGIAGGIKSVGDAAAAQDEQGTTANSVIGNVGMAGSAGTQRVASGGGTLPAPKKAARPAYNEKMPTEKLLMVAVGYLASIDNTLRTQIQNDRAMYQKQVQVEKEAVVENKRAEPFSQLGDKLGFMDKKPSGGMAKKLLIGGALLGGLTAIGISKLDTSELDALKSNVEAFKSEYGWLVDMGSFIGVGGFLGFLRGGIKGGLAGIVAEYVVDKLWHSPLNPYAPKDENGNPIQAEGGAAKGALMAGLGAMAARSSMKKLGAGAGMKALDVMTRPNYATMSAGGRAGARKAGLQGAGKATAWFASRGGRRFLIMLQRRLGKQVMQKIAGVLARIVGGFLLTATGVGAIPGIIMTLLSVGLLISGVKDIAVAIWEVYQEWKETKDVDKTDAIPVAGETVSGAAATSGNMQTIPPAAKGSIDAILNKNPEQLSESELRQLVEAQGRIEDPRGVTNNPGGIRYGTGPLKEHQIGFKKANDDSSVKIAVYDTAENGIRAAMENWKNSKYYKGKSVREGLGTWSGGNGAQYAKMLGSAQPGYTGTTTPSGSEAGFSLSGAFETGKAIFGKAGGALIGAQNYMPSDAGKNTTAKIVNMSKQIETAMTVGNKQEIAKSAGAVSAAQKSVAQASNDGTLGALDPNYPGTGDAIMKYLAHWKFAA